MSIEGEDFTVASVDSRFDVAPKDPLKNVIQTWVLENAKNWHSPVRLLACFHHATKMLSIAVNPYIAAHEM